MRLIVLAICLALGACSSVSDVFSGNSYNAPPPDPNIFPSDYRKQIVDYVTKSVSDPTGIRLAFVSEPALKMIDRDNRYLVCLRYDAKGPDGRYAGVKERAAFFYAGSPTAIVDATKEMCAGSAYQPYPELQQICLTNCKPSGSIF